MNVRIRGANMPKEKRDFWDARAQEYINEKLADAVAALRSALTRRAVAAMYLAANDQHNLGMKRASRLAEGLMEIIMGNADETSAAGAVFNNGTGIDPTLDAMLCEAASRGMYITFPGWGGHDSIEQIHERLGDAYEVRRDAHRRLREYRVDGGKKKTPPDAGTSGRDAEKEYNHVK